MWTVKVKTGEDSFEIVEIPTTPRLIAFLGVLSWETEVSVSGMAHFKMEKAGLKKQLFDANEIANSYEEPGYPLPLDRDDPYED